MINKISVKFFSALTAAAIFLLTVFLCLKYSRTYLRAQQSVISQGAESREPLYLPSVSYVRLLTFGFDGLFSDILWFNTLNYFGKQFRGEKDYRWLAHMCDLVSSLDSKASHVYEFCATLLSWVAREPEKSNKILTKAIQIDSNNWRYLYLRGFNYWYFLDRKDLAREDIQQAASIQGAPVFLSSLASRLIAVQEDPRLAFEFLQDAASRTKDNNAKSALIEQAKLAKMALDIRALKNKIQDYENKYGQKPQSWGDLLAKGLMQGIPLDPFGSAYVLDSSSLEISSLSGRKPLSWTAKTAETGLANAFRQEENR